MQPTNQDTDFVVGLGKLPLDIIGIILKYIPKHILPELLYFPPIRKMVAMTMLSNVHISNAVRIHRRGKYYYSGHCNHYCKFDDDDSFDQYSEVQSGCRCTRFVIRAKDLQVGVNQWIVYPTISVDNVEEFIYSFEDFPELFKRATYNHGIFHVEFGKGALYKVESSGITFESLELEQFGFLDHFSIGAKNLKLINTSLDNYAIGGVNKLVLISSNCDYYYDPEEDIHQDRTNQFSSHKDLEDLSVIECDFDGIMFSEYFPRSRIEASLIFIK